MSGNSRSKFVRKKNVNSLLLGNTTTTTNPLNKNSHVSSNNGPRDITTLLSQQARGNTHFGDFKGKRFSQDATTTNVYSIGSSSGSKTTLHRQPPEVTGQIHEPRRGVYYSSELLHHRDAKAYNQEFQELERVCIIRFPPDIASLLRQRLAAHQAGLDCSFSAEEVPMGPLETSELGLIVTPTPGEDYRIFDVSVEKRLGNPASTIKLAGILVELPCLLEAYKSLEGELLFKANDISQMIYVYDPNTVTPNGATIDLHQIRDTQLWEWHSGLTPGTHRIRHRRFKNFNVFDKSDVAAAERELFNVLNQRMTRETSELEASTEFVMEEHLEALRTWSGFEKNVTAVIGPENPIFYAALHQMTPSTASPLFNNANHPNLLRHCSELQVARFTCLEDRLRFSCIPDLTVNEDNTIPDDLSDKLFGEMKPDSTDQAQDDLQLEEEVRALGFGSLAPSSDASVSSEEDARTRKERRQKKKSKHHSSQALGTSSAHI